MWEGLVCMSLDSGGKQETPQLSCIEVTVLTTMMWMIWQFPLKLPETFGEQLWLEIELKQVQHWVIPSLLFSPAGSVHNSHAGSGSPETAAHSRAGWRSAVRARSPHQRAHGYGCFRCHHHLLVRLAAESPQAALWPRSAVGGNTSRWSVISTVLNTTQGNRVTLCIHCLFNAVCWSMTQTPEGRKKKKLFSRSHSTRMWMGSTPGNIFTADGPAALRLKFFDFLPPTHVFRVSSQS